MYSLTIVSNENYYHSAGFLMSGTALSATPDNPFQKKIKQTSGESYFLMPF